MAEPELSASSGVRPGHLASSSKRKVRENPCQADRFPRRGPQGTGRTRNRRQEEPRLCSVRPVAAPAAGQQAAEEASDRMPEPDLPARARVRTLDPLRVRARPASEVSAELLPLAFPWAWQKELWPLVFPMESAELLRQASPPRPPEPVLRRCEILRRALVQGFSLAARQELSLRELDSARQEEQFSREALQAPQRPAREFLRAGWPTRRTNPLRELLLPQLLP